MRYLKICLAILLIPCWAALAGGNPSDFETGNALYAQGKFQEAHLAYQTVLQTGNYSANLFYNLANTDFRLDDLGHAALNYERALHLDPSLPEARANLSFVRGQTGAKTTAVSWLDYFFADLSSNAYSILASIGGWAALFCLVAAYFMTPRRAFVTGAVVALMLCGYSLAAIRFMQRDSALAVVTAKRSDARFAPLENSTLAETLPAGSHVRILTHSGSWAYCELPDGGRAWLPDENIEALQPKPGGSQTQGQTQG